jgi:hypothetical protein
MGIKRRLILAKIKFYNLENCFKMFRFMHICTKCFAKSANMTKKNFLLMFNMSRKTQHFMLVSDSLRWILKNGPKNL